MPTQPLNTAAIEARLAAATPGPWTRTHDGRKAKKSVFLEATAKEEEDIYGGPSRYGPHRDYVCNCLEGGPIDKEQALSNADLIAHAPADLRALLDEVREVRELRELVKDAFKEGVEKGRGCEGHHWSSLYIASAAMPACPVDSTPEAPPCDEPHEGSVKQPQPALDVAGLVAETETFCSNLDKVDGRGTLALIERLYTALTTAAAQLDAAKESHMQAQVQLAGCLIAAEGGVTDTAKQGDYGWSLAYQRTLDLQAQLAQAEARAERAENMRAACERAIEALATNFNSMETKALELAARVAEVERERDEWKSYKDRVEVSERERDTDRARLHASDDLAVKNAIERDAYKESVQGAGVVIHRIKAERDAALTRAADAEKALAEISPMIGDMAKQLLPSENLRYDDRDGADFQPAFEKMVVMARAIRRVLLGGAG